MIRTKGRRRLACYHEAGHALARWWMGFHTENVVVLTVEQVRAGVTVLDRRDREHAVEGMVNGYDIHMPLAREMVAGARDADRAWLSRQVEVRTDMALMELYAGPFAEVRFRKCAALACFMFGGDQDMAQAREIAAAWFDDEVDRRAAHFRADRRAAALVRSRKGWMAISALASAVFRKGEIDGDEVDALCAGVYGGEFRYGVWDKAWPPTLEQIRDGHIPEPAQQEQAA